MTTFDIDNTKKTKYREVLESLVEQAHALQAIHNPHTWRLSALTFALHLHDCLILFSQLKERWAERLPFSEAWDVDFSEWKNRIWSLVNNVSSFAEDSAFQDWQRLCEEDYHTFLEKANDCLAGDIPLKDLTDFLSEKNTELKKVIMDSGQDLSMLFTDTEEMLYNSDSALYETFYNDLANIYLRENVNPYQIDDNGMPVPYERWKASKSRKRLPDLLLSKTKSANTAMLEIKFWQETWDECFDFEKREIDKEGFARFIFQNRKSIIESKTYPCKNCLTRCFSTLCLCEHLWLEYDRIMRPDAIFSMPNPSRQSIIQQLLLLADKGDWDRGITTDSVRKFLRTILGSGEECLTGTDAELSEKLWRLLESGRGDRVKIVWQNMVGYLDDKRLFRLKGSPALNKDFFGDDKGYTNIDKGRPNKGLMTADFESITPLLDAYVPKLDKKA